MDEAEFRKRTKQRALRIVHLVESLPRSQGADVLGRQLLRSGTSIGGNYRAACRGKSVADVISTLGCVEEEADESLYWMELLTEGGHVKAAQLADLMEETEEILSMTVASIKTLRRKL